MDIDQLMYRSTFVSGSGREFAAKGCLFLQKFIQSWFCLDLKEFRMLEFRLSEKFCNGRQHLAENSRTEAEKEIELPSCSR
jgi:hypothetical protein